MKKTLCLFVTLVILSLSACTQDSLSDNTSSNDSSSDTMLTTFDPQSIPQITADVDKIIGEEQNRVYILTTEDHEIGDEFIFDFNGRQLPVKFENYQKENYLTQKGVDYRESSTSKSIILCGKEYHFDELQRTIAYNFSDDRLNQINIGKNFVLYYNRQSNSSVTICTETGALESFKISSPYHKYYNTEKINPNITEDELASIANNCLTEIYGKEYCDSLKLYSVTVYKKSKEEYVNYKVKYNYYILGIKAFEVTVCVGNDGGVTDIHSDYTLQQLYKAIITEERIQKALDIAKGLMNHLDYTPYGKELSAYIYVLPDGTPALRLACSSGLNELKQSILKNICVTLI